MQHLTFTAKAPETSVALSQTPLELHLGTTSQSQVSDAPRAAPSPSDWRIGSGIAIGTDGKLDVPVEIDRRLFGPVMVGGRAGIPINGGPVSFGVVISVEF